jgi:hypothetical protein
MTRTSVVIWTSDRLKGVGVITVQVLWDHLGLKVEGLRVEMEVEEGVVVRGRASMGKDVLDMKIWIMITMIVIIIPGQITDHLMVEDNRDSSGRKIPQA